MGLIVQAGYQDYITPLEIRGEVVKQKFKKALSQKSHAMTNRLGAENFNKVG